MTRADLIAALEKAEGPSRELDGDIAEMCGVVPAELEAMGVKRSIARRGRGSWYGAEGAFWHAPAYTASLDAALTLVPNGWVFTLSTDDNASFPNAAAHARCANVPWASAYVNRVSDAHAATPAIALCIAALKARE